MAILFAPSLAHSDLYTILPYIPAVENFHCLAWVYKFKVVEREERCQNLRNLDLRYELATADPATATTGSNLES